MLDVPHRQREIYRIGIGPCAVASDVDVDAERPNSGLVQRDAGFQMKVINSTPTLDRANFEQVSLRPRQRQAEAALTVT